MLISRLIYKSASLISNALKGLDGYNKKDAVLCVLSLLLSADTDG